MAFREDEFLQLSGIQHFCFCRRQWALIHIENAWEENGLTAEGRSIHRRVHNKNIRDSCHGIKSIRGMRIRSEILGLSGECDLVELIPVEDGITLTGRYGTWSVRPVEYKHGSPKYNDCDRVQLAAQVMCLEEMLCCQIPEGAIYYAETKRRERVEITRSLREITVQMINEMHGYYRQGTTPVVRVTARCEKCSLNAVCMVGLIKKRESRPVDRYILDHIME